MQSPPITLDVARGLLMCEGRQVRIASHVGALFLQALWKKSQQGQGLTFDAWCQHVQPLGHRAPDRTAMRRRLTEIERCLLAVGCDGAVPLVHMPPRGATVGPWQLREDVCARLSVLHGDDSPSQHGMARLTLGTPDSEAQLKILNCFLVGDDLARNGMFVDAAATMANALKLQAVSPELQCVLHFRKAKYLRRAGHYAKARANLTQVSALLPQLSAPMQGAVQAEHAVQGWRVRYDDVAHPEKYPAIPPLTAHAHADFHIPPVDSRLMWQQFNLWASQWRRQMDVVGDPAAVQTAFTHARQGYEAALYWALVSEDALNVMNVAANMGYLLHQSGQKKLADRSVEALQWLLLSQAYIERFEWPEESLWDYVYLAELYASSPAVRKHLKAHSAYVMNALTPDSDAFYAHAVALGVRLGEPRQLADMYRLRITFLGSSGDTAKATEQECLLNALMDRNPGLREKVK